MTQLQTLLEHKLTGEQEEILSQYPRKAVERAISKLERRGEKKSFNYFLAILKNDSPPTGSVRSGPVPQPSYVRILEKECPLEACVTILDNLSQDSSDNRGNLISIAMKVRGAGAHYNPWWWQLSDEQRTALQEVYPWSKGWFVEDGADFFAFLAQRISDKEKETDYGKEM